jgi:hypothetical protein
MNDELPFQKLDVYKAAEELARLVHEAQIRDAELRDQATRGAKSTFLGLCEGLPSDSSGVRRRHFEIANGSLHEVVARSISPTPSAPSTPSERAPSWRSPRASRRCFASSRAEARPRLRAIARAQPREPR